MDKEPLLLKSQLKKLNKRHGAELSPGESYLAVFSGVATDKPQPSTMWVFFGALGAIAGQLLAKPAAKRRQEELSHRFGYGEFGSFPESKNGYMIATTQSRVLVFSGNGKKLLVDGPIGPMTLTALDHGDKITSVVFTDGNERIAVSSLRPTYDSAKHFIATFPSDRVTMSAPQFAGAGAGAGVREF